MKIRESTEHDIPRLVELGQKFFDMTELDKVTNYDPDSTREIIKALTNGKDSIIFVLDTGSEVVGAVGATIYPFYFNKESKVAQELFWFVEEAHRGSLSSVKLFKKLENWARDNGATTISMVALGCNYDQVSEFYIGQGYYRQETHFMRRL